MCLLKEERRSSDVLLIFYGPVNVVELGRELRNSVILHCFLWEALRVVYHLEVNIILPTFQLIQPFVCIYSNLLNKARQCMLFQFIKCTSDTIFQTFDSKNTSGWQCS